MIRTQIQLPPGLYDRLRRRAGLTSKSMAQQIREAVELYLAREEGRTPISLDEIAGRFPDLPPDPDMDPLVVALAEAFSRPAAAAGGGVRHGNGEDRLRRYVWAVCRA